MSEPINDHMALICGESATGKSAALRNLEDPEKWLYLNCEAGKRLPFKSKFEVKRIVDPYQVMEAGDFMLQNPEQFPGGLIVDTSTFLMDMMESQYVLTSSNTQKAWGEYSQFWKRFMQEKVAELDCPVLIDVRIVPSARRFLHRLHL